MLDPLNRWRQYGMKPDYAGALTFGEAPYTEDPADLKNVDVAIVGAPFDDLVTERAGPRWAPRAIRGATCPSGPHLEAGVDAFEQLRIVDYGDAPVVPANPEKAHRAIEETVSEVVKNGTIALVLGGDHSITEPSLRAHALTHGELGLVHFDAHTDTAAEVFGATLSHATQMRKLVEAGHVDGSRYVQIGIRGYWPGEEEFGWQAEHGVTSFFMHDVRDRGIREVVQQAIEVVGTGPIYMSVDIDCLDPAFGPGGMGSPEPGGMTSTELLWATRTLAAELDLVGADFVEVIPTGFGTTDAAALVAERTLREILTGIALRRR